MKLYILSSPSTLHDRSGWWDGTSSEFRLTHMHAHTLAHKLRVQLQVSLAKDGLLFCYRAGQTEASEEERELGKTVSVFLNLTKLNSGIKEEWLQDACWRYGADLPCVLDQPASRQSREVFSYAIRRFGSLEVQMTELKYLYGVFLSQQGERSGEGVSPGNYYKNPSSEIIYYAVEYICMYFKGPICKIWWPLTARI